ncbi:hypothetical protein [Lederbergia ruris]|uniref:Uncharacterized protein n=1 Tax=Lederbergia ruris TaxID=217495 RepID=A0ABQ4KMT9_9BACI|nr:hypothetical protein [Lederbergia ruris]GIN58682.1 hypothetical protein J8TS2_30010 [Lederbergia ruris]
MTIVKFMIIIMGIILLFIMGYQITMYLRPGIFPPKRVVKERIFVSGGVGLFFLIMGIVITIFGK